MFFNSFYLVTLLNGLVLIAALLFRKENRLPNLLLSILLTAVLFAQGVVVLLITGGIEHYPLLVGSTFPARLLVPSLFFLYVQGLTVPGFKWSRRYWFHFLPFLFAITAYLAFLFFSGARENFQQKPWMLWGRYFTLVIAVAVTGAYLFFCFRQLQRFQKIIPLYFSDLIHVRLQWLRVLLALFTVPWLVALADVLTGPSIFPMEEVIVPLVTVTILIMGFFGLKQSVIFSGKEAWGPTPEAPPVSEVPPPSEKKEVKALFFSAEQLAQWKVRLEKYMEEKKPYLEPEYRLVDLAHGLGLKPYQVSEILNRGVGVPFYDFINRYRIEEAKRRLGDPAFEHIKILAIAMDCGFNSKSSFNDTFRRFTGVTPSQFRAPARI